MIRPRVKICGVKTAADALVAVRFGADAIGLNFHPPSPRCVTELIAREIIAALPPFVEPVLLSVNEEWSVILERVARLPGAGLVQIHGDRLTPPPPGAEIRWMPALPVRDADSLRAIGAFLDECRASGSRMPSAVLVDAHVPGQYGGTGQVAPWDLLRSFAPGVPVVLAGGLTPDNVFAAIEATRPFAVDVASGVESSPGVKDAEKVRRFVSEAGRAWFGGENPKES